jgi:anaerobic selenocysteine-containing dehydrogenase
VAVSSVAPAVMKPLFDTRGAGDVLLEVAQKLKKPIDLPWKTYEELLKATFDQLGEDAWSTAQKQGGWWGELPARLAAASAAAPAEGRPAPVRYTAPEFAGEAGQFPFHFLPYSSAAFLDGSLAHLSWLQELPDTMTSAMWSSWVEVNPKTAERLGVRTGDVVEVASQVGAVRAPAFVSPAIAPDVVAMPVGQGHQNYTRYASGRGANPIEILSPAVEPTTGALAWAATRVKVTRVGDPDGKLILFSARGELREMPQEGRTR